MRRQAHPHFVFAKDGFYDDISRLHRAAREVTYHELEHVTGRRSTTVDHEPGVKRRLERLLGIRITRWDTDSAEENGVFYQGFARGAKAETPAIHADWPEDGITIVVYLTSGLPADCGTCLWRHKRTDWCVHLEVAHTKGLAVGAKHLAHHETRFATAERLEDVHTERSALAHDP